MQTHPQHKYQSLCTFPDSHPVGFSKTLWLEISALSVCEHQGRTQGMD